MTPHPESSRDARNTVYLVLLTLALGVAGGRIFSTERLHEPSVHRPDSSSVPRPPWPKVRPEPSPMFGSNDRSRWALARALVEEGSFVIGRRDPLVVASSGPAVLAAADPLGAVALLAAGYQARIASDRGIIFEDGYQSVDKVLHPARLEFYSTKPPLLSLFAAGGYWLLRSAFGWTMTEQPFRVVLTLVALFNLLSMLVTLLVLMALAERFGRGDWGRYFIVAAGGFATLMTPFMVTLNNHTIATAAVAAALYATVRIREGGGVGWHALVGLASGLAVGNELPCAALAAGLVVYLLPRSPGRTLAVTVPLLLLPLAVSAVTNYVELGQWRPAYAMFGGPWYEYEGSHWRLPPGGSKRGIDFAGRNGEPRAVYAFHLLLGHHGWFSLMPIMFLGLAGMVFGLRSQDDARSAGSRDLQRSFSLATLLISAVVIAFYLIRSDNYGGWSNGPRWLMWLTPLWLVCMLPVLDRLDRSPPGRLFALLLLVASILSMTYQMWSPWRHPWIFNWMESRGWISY